MFSPPSPACGSALGGSREGSTHERSGIAMGFHPHSADIDQPLALQPLMGHPGLCLQRPRQVPVALAERRQDRVAFARPQGQQDAHLGSRSAPLFPVAHADAAAQPRVKFRDRAVVVRDAKMAHLPVYTWTSLCSRQPIEIPTSARSVAGRWA